MAMNRHLCCLVAWKYLLPREGTFLVLCISRHHPELGVLLRQLAPLLEHPGQCCRGQRLLLSSAASLHSCFQLIPQCYKTLEFAPVWVLKCYPTTAN